MDFYDYFFISEIEMLISESPVLTTKLAGSTDPKLSKLLDPKTGKAWRKENSIELLKIIRNQQEAKGVDPKELWVSFSAVTRLGINPQAEDGETPIGLYGYPIDYVIKEEGNVPYGSSRKYMLVFKTKRDDVISMKVGEKEFLPNYDKHKENLDVQIIYGNIREFFLGKRNLFQRKIKKFAEKIVDPEIKNLYEIATYSFLWDSIGDLRDSLQSLTTEELQDMSLIKTKMNQILNDFVLESGSDNEISEIEQNIESHLDHMTFYDDDENSEKASWKPKYESVEFDRKSGKLFFNLSPKAAKKFGKEKNGINEILRHRESTQVASSSMEAAYRDNRSDYDEEIDLRKNIIKWLIATTVIGKKISNSISFFKSKIESFFESIIEKIKETKNSIRFPFEKELKKYCEKYGLDWFPIFQSTMYKISNKSKNEKTQNLTKICGAFVYRFTEQLAKKITENNLRKKFVVWTQILRELGFSGLADEEGNSAIHAGEPVQGVFFDPRQFELVDVVKNASHIGRDFSGYDHYGKEYQRRGRKIQWSPEDSAVDRWINGLISATGEHRAKINTFSREVQDYGYRRPSEDFRLISKILILVKTIINQRKIILKGSEEIVGQFYNEIKYIKESIIKYKINILKRIKEIEGAPPVFAHEKSSLEKMSKYYDLILNYLERIDSINKKDLSQISKIRTSSMQDFKTVSKPWDY